MVAAFRQPSSRANDPALHTHCVTMNITFHEGKARSLSSDPSREHGVIEQIKIMLTIVV
ncbi:relaxase domain-containing protein [Legionella pneumophila]|nr:relaxase domain-containing protein [Legionella pneumophila]